MSAPLLAFRKQVQGLDTSDNLQGGLEGVIKEYGQEGKSERRSRGFEEGRVGVK